jgi:hypothetical protein
MIKSIVPSEIVGAKINGSAGLTSAEVRRRLAEIGPNVVVCRAPLIAHGHRRIRTRGASVIVRDLQ